MAAELQRTNPAELLYAEDFAEMALIEGRRGLRRRPLWEFEIDTARQQLNLQFGTRDLIGLALKTHRAAVRCGLPAAIRERYPAHRPAAYPLYHHGAPAGQHHHGCRHAP
jgi:DNA mismatch repair ATPase MutS